MGFKAAQEKNLSNATVYFPVSYRTSIREFSYSIINLQDL